MTENYEHYISRNIKTFYRKRLFSPILYLLILGALWFVLKLGNLLVPKAIPETRQLSAVYTSGDLYVTTELKNLTFTGYTTKQNGYNEGYFYYTLRDDQVTIVLLSPRTCEEGIPEIESLKFRGKVVKQNKTYNALLGYLAEDLDWTKDGITKELPHFYLSEPDYHLNATVFLFIFYFGSMAYAALSLISYILYIRFPFLSPACQDLVVFGNPKRMLEEAEEELATLPQLATEDIFITEHYFIVTSPYGTAFLPIKEIMWIYKYSTLHKFLWYHMHISYTLHISAKKHLYIRCPKNIKSDIDGIMDYLAEANHDILTGFSEENRLKVQAVQGKPFHIEKWVALMHKRL